MGQGTQAYHANVAYDDDDDEALTRKRERRRRRRTIYMIQKRRRKICHASDEPARANLDMDCTPHAQ